MLFTLVTLFLLISELYTSYNTDKMARPGKRGLCWPNDNVDPVFPFTKPSSKITWL